MIGLAVYAGARIPHGATAPRFLGVNSAGGAVALAIPEHEPGDLIIKFTKSGLFNPSPYTDFTTPPNGTWTTDLTLQHYRLEWYIDPDGSLLSIGTEFDTVSVVLVYGITSFGNVAIAATGGPVTSLASPSLASSSGDGSLMLSIFTTNNQAIDSVTGAFVTRYDQDSGLGGGDVVIVESDGLVPTSPATTGNFAGSTYPTSQTFELLPE